MTAKMEAVRKLVNRRHTHQAIYLKIGNHDVREEPGYRMSSEDADSMTANLNMAFLCHEFPSCYSAGCGNAAGHSAFEPSITDYSSVLWVMMMQRMMRLSI